jgi:fimbrial chaperone protein
VKKEKSMKAVHKLIISILILAGALPAYAFKFSPISVDLKDSGQGSIYNFQALNDTDAPLALKVTLFRRTMDTGGNEIRTECPDDFIIFPARMVLKPGEKRTVRVRYKGREIESTEKAYRIIAEQIPADFGEKENSSGLNLIFRYIGSIYIVPENLTHNLILTEIRRENSENGQFLVLRIENRGSSHTVVSGLHIRLTGTSGTITLEPEDLKNLDDTNLLAGSVREYRIPLPPGLGEGEIKGALEFEALR